MMAAEGVHCVVRAPLRIDLTGGCTDIEPLVSRFPSRTVNVAIDRYVTASGKRAAGGLSTVRITDPRGADLRAGPRCAAEIARQRGLAALIAHIMMAVGVEADLAVSFDLPLGCGLGTSGAMTVAVSMCLFGLGEHHDVPLMSLPHFAAAMERIVGHAGGIQDQLAATLGGFKCYSFSRGVCEWQDLSDATNVISGIQVAVPPQPRDGAGLVAAIMKQINDGNDPSAKDPVFDLLDVGQRLFAALSDTPPRTSVVHALVLEVASIQSRLHPLIGQAMASTPLWRFVESGRCCAKPLGGAGPGAAWVIFPPVHKDIQAAVAAAGWSLHPVRVSQRGVSVISNWYEVV